MTKAEKSALKEICSRCPEREKHCGLTDYPNQCVKAGHFITGYEKAEKDLVYTIDRLCEAILFDWDNKADVAIKTLKDLEEKKQS